MLSFMVPSIDALEDATSIIAAIKEVVVDLKFSPEMFSIILHRSSITSIPCCFMSLQLFPPFFTQFSCHKLQYSWIFIDYFLPTLSKSKRDGFSSLTFSSSADQVDLKYQAPNGRVRKTDFKINPANDSWDVGDFNLGVFVSIGTGDFINIIAAFRHYCSRVLVTLTNSQVKFSTQGTNDIKIRTLQGRQCIIGGIEADHCEISFNITLQSASSFLRMAFRSKRVWLFKVDDNTNNGVVSFPLGLYTRFLVYLPTR